MKIVLVYAHPDDESFSVGGTLAKYKHRAENVSLICATRGEAGSCGDPALCKPWELGEVRSKELKRAAKILGIKNIYFLGLRDATLAQFTTDFLAKLIVPILKDEKPDVVITFAPTGISGHNDHIKISQVAKKAFQEYSKKNRLSKLYYSTLPESIIQTLRREGLIRNVFSRPFAGTKDEKITTKVAVKKFLPTKFKALKCHKTQHKDWERFIKRMHKGLSDFEYFVLAPQTNLFD
ncbi:PIG-L family deacetylase [Candidatus Gottesmanbacteria bacterium]|nr:PIG-L family deacetylase [Candidatus Gottesmanbacteria bacterium]